MGEQSIEFDIPKGVGLANVADKQLRKTRDVLFLRYYSKFDKSFDVSGSSHNGCSISAGYFRNGGCSGGWEEQVSGCIRELALARTECRQSGSVQPQSRRKSPRAALGDQAEYQQRFVNDHIPSGESTPC